MSEIDDGLQVIYIYATLQMVIIYSICSTSCQKLMMDFKLYICYAADGYNIWYFVQHHVRNWWWTSSYIYATLQMVIVIIYSILFNIMKCVWVFLCRRNCHNDMYKCLGDLCRKSGWNKDVGNAEEKTYSCLFQHDGFRPTKTIEITPWLSFFHTLPWLLTHPQNIDICEKPLSLWRNLGTSLNRIYIHVLKHTAS